MLKRLLEAERQRNREREDELVSRIATSRGTYGVLPRERSAYESQPRHAYPPAQVLPDLKKLNAAEQEEYALWLRDAAEHGIHAAQATQEFLNDLMLRRQPISEGEM